MRLTRTAGGVILGPDGRIAVVSQKGRTWSLPKGGVEDGETDLEAARREIGEEIGVDDVVWVETLGEYERWRASKDGGDDKSERKSIVIFLFRTKQTALSPRDKANPEARWVPREEVEALLSHRKDKKFFREILHRIPHI